MSNEDDEDYVTVSVCALLLVEKTVRMERKEAERIAGMSGFDLRMAVDEVVSFNSGDILNLEDVTLFEIEEDEDYGEEE